MSEAVVETARGWVRSRTGPPHLDHLERTLHWADELGAPASTALRIAAVTHDIERSFPGGAAYDPAWSWDDEDYNRQHQDRSADLVAAWLHEEGADPPLVERVDALVRAHEDGGWPEADLLQAADSLSFLETMVGLVAGWTRGGRAPLERATGKLVHMQERMAVERARELGAPLLERALAECRRLAA